jgi:hypothetical protein
MGVVGSLLAWQLLQRKVPFTWNDAETNINAWSASTGCIYPSGDPLDTIAYNVWKNWVASPPWRVPGMVETSGYWFCTKSAPNGLKGGIEAQVGPLRRSTFPAMNFNAQAFVAMTRKMFAMKRLTYSAPRAKKVVVTHGFGERLHHYVWGWHRKVRLRFHEDLVNAEFCKRMTISLTRGRFVMAYAYPMPGYPEWYYAGSDRVVQKTAKELEVLPKYEAWRRNFTSLSGGLIEIMEEGGIAQGWRPAGRPDDDAMVMELTGRFGSVLVKPQRGNGVRHAPLVCRAVMTALGF